MTCIASCREIYHHGILGQRWGIRRGPPYPIGAFKIKKKRNHPEKISKQTQNIEKDSNESKYIKTGLAIAGACLVAYGGYKLYSSGKLDALANSGRKILYESNLVKGLDSKVSLKDKYADALDKVNPFDTSTRKGSTNCGYCSLSGYLRSDRNMHIKANATFDGNGINLSETAKQVFIPPDGRWGKNNLREGQFAGSLGKTPESVGNFLIRCFGDNAQGVAGFSFNMPGRTSQGHAFNWTVENGQVRFYDFQRGSSSENDPEYFDFIFSHIDPAGLATLVRLDNCDINMDNVNKVGTFVK